MLQLEQQIYCPSFIVRQDHRKNLNEHNMGAHPGSQVQFEILVLQ